MLGWLQVTASNHSKISTSAMKSWMIPLCLLCALLSSMAGVTVASRDFEFPAELDGVDSDFVFGNATATGTSVGGNATVEAPVNIKFRIDAASAPCKQNKWNFCDATVRQEYPARYIRSLLTKAPEQYTHFENRMSLGTDQPSDDDLCASVKSIKYPQIARNTDHHWHFIINLPEFRQPIPVEVCKEHFSKCLIDSFLRTAYGTYCKQTTRSIPLLSLDVDGEIRVFNYTFPSHCQCKLKRWSKRPHRKPSY